MHEPALQDGPTKICFNSGEPGAAQGDGKTLDATLSKNQVHAIVAASYDFNLGRFPAALLTTLMLISFCVPPVVLLIVPALNALLLLLM